MSAVQSRKMWVMVSEVAAVLRMEPKEVRRCMEEDGLPSVRIPGRKRTARRIFLRSLYKWLAERSTVEAVGSFEEFQASFESVEQGAESEE